MFQPDEPGGLRNSLVLWLIIVGVLYAYLITSCTTPEKQAIPAQESTCPETVIDGAAPSDPEVIEHLTYARKGCISHYGVGACLITLSKIGPRNYHATCRSAPQQRRYEYDYFPVTQN